MRALLRKVRKHCQLCKNRSAKPQPPRMAEHPSARLAAYALPFTYVGIDLFGPYEVSVGRHVEKRWPMLFTCLTIRAIHIEIVYSLDKHSCIMSIRNFIARRGTPTEIRTDNGTNFHGANNELKLIWKSHAEELQREFQQTTWIFNPPSAPHMGGCWERLIRCVKNCVEVSMPMRKPNDEQFRSFLMEAENIVNARPLTYIPLDGAEGEALTPNHFLLGSSSGSKPLGVWTDDVYILRKNFRISQRMTDYFWHRWVKEYLPDLTRSTKWYNDVKPIAEGDVVIIMDEKFRNNYRKAIVTRIIPGRDGKIRTVEIKTSDGVLKRPVAKLAVLDVKDADS